MKGNAYRDRWLAEQRAPEPRRVEHLAKQIALSFLDHHYYNEQYEADYIDLLCEMATTFSDPELNKAVASALFGIVVEGLCDNFEELNIRVYNKVMSQVITYYRGKEGGKALDASLRDFGLYTQDDLFERIERIRAASDEPKVGQLDYPEKILILSRVTLGADVAITSVIVQYMAALFPESQIVLIGGGKLHDLFGGNYALQIREVGYSRRGSLAARLDNWHTVREAIETEAGEVPPEKTLVIDPDSRLSQLGVFPLVKTSPYLFFNSRGKDAHPKRISMAELTNHWLNNVFNSNGWYYPQVWLREGDMQYARDRIQRLRAAGASSVIAVNFGVGGNERKRLSSTAEEKLINTFLESPETVVVLDKGAGDEERQRIENIADGVAESGNRVVHQDRVDDENELALDHGLLCVSAGIGQMAGVIAHADEYIGYDSACHHIAAALGVPTCTIFAGSNDPYFVRRWCATGPAQTKLVHVDTITTPPVFDDDDIVARVIHARGEEFQQ